MKLLDILFNRQQARTEMRGMLDRAAAQERDLTVAEQVRFDALGIRLDGLGEELQTLHKH